MSYVQQVLQPGETIRFRTNVHWLVYFAGIAALIVGASLGGWYYWDGQSSLILLLGSIVFAATGVPLAIAAWLKRFGTEIAVTDRRVIYKTGLIRRHSTEITIDKIESVDVDQSILGRMFGYGTLTIRGTGEAVEPLRDIADPIDFRNAIMVR
ncbi:MAG TPA: PH domain-containing protein [Microvirga sp.]|jgi:uncharacterized membrane protein YdbT with pleckstrin-like domain|nr:PH domain-containing protein [Microvirga sp.]